MQAMHGLKVEHARKTAHHERYHSTKKTETYGDNSFQMRLTARAIFRFRTIVRAVTFLFSFFSLEYSMCAHCLPTVLPITFSKLSCQLSLIEPQRRQYMMDCVHFFACGKYSAVNHEMYDPSIHFTFTFVAPARRGKHIHHILLSLDRQMYERMMYNVDIVSK